MSSPLPSLDEFSGWNEKQVVQFFSENETLNEIDFESTFMDYSLNKPLQVIINQGLTGKVLLEKKMKHLQDLGMEMTHAIALLAVVRKIQNDQTNKRSVGRKMDGFDYMMENRFEDAFKWFETSANEGSWIGQQCLGFLYENGFGVARDVNQATEWYNNASENENIPNDCSNMIHMFENFAEQGNASAQWNLGELCMYGDGVEQDYTKAFEWYEKSAEQGHSNAQCILGEMYENGEGVEQDYSKAHEWYFKSAEQGNPDAQFNLGKLYQNEDFCDEDYFLAHEWYLKSAEQGHVNAQCCVAELYDMGYGVERDDFKALEWYTKSAEQGNARAQFYLGNMYEDGRGIESIHEEYVHGCIGERDYFNAFKWYLMSAEQGNTSAQCKLGELYEKGFGVKQDFSKAQEWYHKSAEQGNLGAKEKLEAIHNLLIPLKIDDEMMNSLKTFQSRKKK